MGVAGWWVAFLLRRGRQRSVVGRRVDDAEESRYIRDYDEPVAGALSPGALRPQSFSLALWGPFAAIHYRVSKRVDEPPCCVF